jgi:hypothetical protein
MPATVPLTVPTAVDAVEATSVRTGSTAGPREESAPPVTGAADEATLWTVETTGAVWTVVWTVETTGAVTAPVRVGTDPAGSGTATGASCAAAGAVAAESMRLPTGVAAWAPAPERTSQTNARPAAAAAWRAAETSHARHTAPLLIRALLPSKAGLLWQATRRSS